MRALLIALFACLSAHAEPAPVRSIDSLITLALDKGAVETIGKRTARNLSMPITTKVRAIWIDQDKSPDGFEHVFKVVLNESKPESMIWQKSRLTKTPAVQSIEGQEMRLGLDGTFKSGWTFSGKPGKTKDLPLGKKESKARVDAERQFWTRDSINLEWGK